MTDIKRTCRSLEKGFVTICIPNVLVEKEETRTKTADEIVSLLVIRKKRIEMEKQQVKITQLLKDFYHNQVLVTEI